MKSDYWQKGIASLLAAGLLTVGAIAQDGAEGEVNIKKDPAPTATATPAAPKIGAKAPKPQIAPRDPFVNQLITGISSSGSAPTRGSGRTRSSEKSLSSSPSGGSKSVTASADAKPAAPPKPEPEIPAPDVTVSGIVSSGSGRQAIVNTGAGTRMITAGQKLGDYRVSMIGPNYVTFNYGGKKDFKIKIDSEFGK